jgi:hypothetical protein
MMRLRIGVSASLMVCAVLGAVLGGLSPSSHAQRRGGLPLTDRSAGRSVVIYPAERITLRMNHAHPAHQELACTRCHADATTSAVSTDSLIPEEISCSPCHDDRRDRSLQTVDTCGYCHVGFAPSDTAGAAGVVPASGFAAPHLRFSHRAHVEDGMACTDCHDVAGVRVATRANLPTMRACFQCHASPGIGLTDSPVPTAPSSCETCHLTDPDGLLTTTFDEGWLNPPRWMAGMHHDHEWLVRHRWIGADSGPLCAECHQESECADCHDGRIRPLSVHPGDFLTTHPVMARRDEPRCSSCHTVAQFCTECHARLGISPIAASDVRATTRFHPPSAVWTRGPNLHGLEATRSMTSCASCHGEDDCVTCHAAPGIGAGLSPHPAGFSLHCRSALSTNARACVTCHGDLEELAARCVE